jgi:Tol biopolymer transport system component
MGDQKAQQAFQRLIKEYADQGDIAAEAQTRLQVLKKPERLIAGEGMISRQVWADSQTDPSGSISPDGRYLSFVNWYTGDLLVRDLVTGKNRNLTNNPSGSLDIPNYPKWSPEGLKLAYCWYVRPYAELRIIGIDGSEPRAIYRDDRVKPISIGGWSPDGRLISAFFQDTQTKEQTIALITVQTGEVQVLKKGDQISPELGPFSPDGRYLTYDRPQAEGVKQRDIYLLATDGSGEIPLIEHQADDQYLGWTRESDWFLFRSSRTGGYDAWIIRVANGRPLGNPRLLKPGIGVITSLGITNDGVFFYGFQTRNQDPYILDIDPQTLSVSSKPKRITRRFIGSGTSPAWSPDGNFLAYLSIRADIPAMSYTQALVIQSLNTGEERELNLDESLVPPAGNLRWFPDGRSFLIYGKDRQGNRGLFRIDAQTANVNPLIIFPTDHVFRFPTISPDGNSVYYRLRTDKGLLTKVLRLDVESGEEKVLHKIMRPDMITTSALSPDGSKIAFILYEESQPNQEILQIIPAEGGEPVDILRELISESNNISSRSGLAWTPDGSHILFCRNQGDRDLTYDLWAIPVAGGAPKKMGFEMTRIEQLSVHPGGRQICFTAGRFIDEIWMLENFIPKK